MSLSLLQEYGSSSDSESGSENETATRSAKIPKDQIGPSTQPASQGLGAKLAAILPPPSKISSSSSSSASKRQSGASETAERKKVRIVVDLPSAKGDAAGTQRDTAKGASNAQTTAREHRQIGSGLFSELASILPAPKHIKSAFDLKRQHASETAPKPKSLQATPLIPHSISNKRKAKETALRGVENQPSAIEDNDGDNGERQIDEQKGTRPHAAAMDSGPFFTIGAQSPDAVEEQPEREEHLPEGTHPPAQPQQTELYYDANSGYYYDHASGTYYCYDASSGSYVDASALYSAIDQEQEVSGQLGGADPPPSSQMAAADLEQLIGRGAMKRGEGQLARGAQVKDVSQGAQLRNSGYSDAKAASEFAAVQMAEKQRMASHSLIGSSDVSKKQKQKHNIMYLALQSQEQEAKLKESYMSRRRAKKEARSKYGKCTPMASLLVLY
ncbi:hypothetical protein GQ54DRAFT_266782 [Martensiomyces pterosporus]|nr:hypothetical protein GQ54DRAFT_266782 [Martensiomyces pterosporus]